MSKKNEGLSRTPRTPRSPRTVRIVRGVEIRNHSNELGKAKLRCYIGSISDLLS